jgi:hypothetical protein
MKNLRPDVKLYVRESDVESIDKLISMGKEFERLTHEVQRYKILPVKPKLIVLRQILTVGVSEIKANLCPCSLDCLGWKLVPKVPFPRLQESPELMSPW